MRLRLEPPLVGFYSSQTPTHFLMLRFYQGPLKESRYKRMIFLLRMLGLDVKARGHRTSGLWTVPLVLTGLEHATEPCSALAYSEGRCQLGFSFTRYNGDFLKLKCRVENDWKYSEYLTSDFQSTTCSKRTFVASAPALPIL